MAITLRCIVLQKMWCLDVDKSYGYALCVVDNSCSAVDNNNKKYLLWNAGICPIVLKVGHVTLATPPLGNSLIHVAFATCLALSVEKLWSCEIFTQHRKRQPIGMLGRSNGNHDWLLANASACV